MKIRLAGLLTVGATLLAAYAVPALAAEPTTELRPAQLERGADVQIPHVEGNFVVDGDVRVGFASRPSLLGTSDDAFIVWLSDGRILRVEPTGDRMVIHKGNDVSLEVSADGSRLAVVTGDSTSSKVRIIDTFTGDTVKTRTFSAGWVQALDFEGNRVVLSSFTSADTRTWIWNTLKNSTRQITDRPGYLADLATDRLATYTRDPYDGGCTKLVRISAPTDVLWRSCSDRITALSPAATRMATIHILSDGLGPNRVTLRGAHGGALASYTAQWFGLITFETNKALLLDTNGTKKSALVRCTLEGCVRASDLRDVEVF
jgi:WD40 repeat protein